MSGKSENQKAKLEIRNTKFVSNVPHFQCRHKHATKNLQFFFPLPPWGGEGLEFLHFSRVAGLGKSAIGELKIGNL